jgi:hypothetical protein
MPQPVKKDEFDLFREWLENLAVGDKVLFVAPSTSVRLPITHTDDTSVSIKNGKRTYRFSRQNGLGSGYAGGTRIAKP